MLPPLVQHLDYTTVYELSRFVSLHLWASQITHFLAQGLVVVPFLVLGWLWVKNEPISHHHGNKKAVMLAIMTMVLALAVKAGISFFLTRDRPFVAHPEMYRLPFSVDNSSFPSGHTIVAFSIAFSIWLSGVKWVGKGLLWVALFVAFGRVAAGVHYPTDVLGGMIIALLASLYVHREASTIKRYLPNQ